MPTAAHACRWRSAYSSPAGVDPTRIAVRWTLRSFSFSTSTRAATSSLMRLAKAAPSMTFDAIGGLYRPRWRRGSRARRKRAAAARMLANQPVERPMTVVLRPGGGLHHALGVARADVSLRQDARHARPAADLR